jgi:hypothetical protein
MALAQYSDIFWYPNGTLATSVAVRIFPLNSNILAPLFADLAGTVPLPNPLTTSGTGTISFYAEQGEYWMHADTEAFQIAVGLTPVTPGELAALQAEIDAVEVEVDVLQVDMTAVEGDVTGLQTAVVAAQGDITALDGEMNTAQADIASLQSSAIELMNVTLSSGITAGGDITPNVVSPSAINISPLVGYITDFTSDPFNPSITRVDFPGVTGLEMDAGSLARTVTSWLIDANQVITQVPSPTTNEQRRTHIRIGLTRQVGGVITVDQSLPVILQQPANQLSDLMVALGPFSISGNNVTPNGVNLMINQSTGKLFSQGFNHFVGPVQTNDPHVTVTQAQTPAQFRYVTSTSAVFGALRNTLDVVNYAPGGVITPIGGGVGTSSIHRVYLFPANNAVDQMIIQYGMNAYSSLANAVNALGAGIFTPNPMLADAALIGYIAVTRSATSLSDPTQATFVHAGKFATP